MQAKGWIAEGFGEPPVFACLPSLLEAPVGAWP